MTITQLETFLKIVDTKNFTAAAANLGYAQSTVTTQIRQLEDELDCLLFDRLGKTIVLTAAGERLQLYADRMMQIEREIHLEVPDSVAPAGLLKLGVSESLCYNRLPHKLMSFKEKFPNVEIRLQFINHDTFPDMLRKGELDLVYTLNPEIVDDSLKLLYRHPETLSFFVCPTHPLAKKTVVTEEDLSEVPLLLTSHNCSFRQMLLAALANARITPKTALETSSKEILKQFAANGLGAAFMPDMAAEEEVKNKSLKRLNWKGAKFPVFSQVFIHKDKHENRITEEFVHMVALD